MQPLSGCVRLACAQPRRVSQAPRTRRTGALLTAAAERPPAPPFHSPFQASYALTLELSEADNNFDDKIDILELNGLQQASEFVLRADAAPDEGLLPLLRLLNLQGAPSCWGRGQHAASAAGAAGGMPPALRAPRLRCTRPSPLPA